MNIDITNRDTWPEVLSPIHMALIFDLSVGTINRRCTEGTFQPAPIGTESVRGRERRWRKADVLRWLDGVSRRRTA